ncbi:uncharacterized protein [Euphorbia lathyris]|uniref:uncharacterized protein n=1 Tax=Euphorbia lathyris TaxID=212925 RepID=UPI0033144AFE
MDQHDLRTSGVANSFRNFHSPEMPDPLGKAKSSSNSHEVISDGCNESDRKKHSSVSDHEVNCYESAQSAATERTSLTHDHLSSLYCSKENADDSLLLSSVVSPQCSELVKENLAEVSCRVMSGNGNQDSGASASPPKNISMKSDVSMDDRLTPDRERNELVDRKMNEHWLHVDGDSSKSLVATCHSKQPETESTSSNSTRVILPASSNDSSQETSVNANSRDRGKHSGTDSCIATDFKCSPEGSAVKSSASVIDTQNASQYGVHLTGFSPENISHLDNRLKTVDSAGTRCDELVGMITDYNLVTAEKSELQKSNSSEKENSDFPEFKPCFELNNAPEVVLSDVAPEVRRYREASGSCSSSVRGESGEIIHMSSVASAVSDKDCSTETGSKFHLGNALDRCDSSFLEKDEFDLKMSIRSLDAKDTSKYRDHEEKDKDNVGLHVQGSSPLTTNPEYLTATIHKHNFVSRFDLNEEIFAEEVDNSKLSIKEMVSFHAQILLKPIPMVAKSGMSIGFPTCDIQLDEASGWKGSAATSAFRATFPQCMSRIVASSAMIVSKDSEFLQPDRIDLNVAAEGGDCDMEFLVEKHVQAFSSFPSEEPSNVSATRAEKFDIDLNCVGEDDDNGHQLCLPASSYTNAVKCFDLNYNPTSADESGDPCLSSQCPSVQRNRTFGDSVVTFWGNVKESEANSTSPAYHVDLSSLQRFSHGQAKPFLMDAPAILPPSERILNMVPPQPRQTYTSYGPPTSLPSQTFMYDNRFFIDPNNRLSSSVYAPGAVKETCFFPQIVASGAPPTFSGTPYIRHGLGVNSGDIAKPSFDPNGGVGSSENGSWGRNGRHMSVPVNNKPNDQMRPFQQLAFFDTPKKRREPDGGWDSCQLGFRQRTS